MLRLPYGMFQNIAWVRSWYGLLLQLSHSYRLDFTPDGVSRLLMCSYYRYRIRKLGTFRMRFSRLPRAVGRCERVRDC